MIRLTCRDKDLNICCTGTQLSKVVIKTESIVNVAMET